MASKDTGKSPGPTMGEAEIYSLMEIALKCAGGEGYYYLSGKEDFLKSLSIKLVECQRKTFLPSKTYEERNGLATEFQVGGDRNEEQVSGSADGSTNGAVTIGANTSAKKLKNEHVMSSKTIPPRSTLRCETGHEVFACKFEVSLKINCDISFSNWKWSLWSSSNDPAKLNDPLKSKSNDSLKSNDTLKSTDTLKLNDVGKVNNSVKLNGHMKTVSARYVLSKLEGWNESTDTAIIELQCRVETERHGIYKLD